MTQADALDTPKIDFRSAERTFLDIAGKNKGTTVLAYRLNTLNKGGGGLIYGPSQPVSVVLLSTPTSTERFMQEALFIKNGEALVWQSIEPKRDVEDVLYGARNAHGYLPERHANESQAQKIAIDIEILNRNGVLIESAELPHGAPTIPIYTFTNRDARRGAVTLAQLRPALRL